MSDLFSVKDQVVIVTGAARGNGRAIAEGFLDAGAMVFCVDILDEVETLEASHGNGRVYPVKCDLREKEAIERLVSRITGTHGRVDVLVNNAGVSLTATDPYNEEIWDRTFEINVRAAFLLSTHVSQVMMRQEGGGAIINITSLGAMLGFPNNPSYVASKGALRQLTKAMARDLAKFNIRINNICPGYMLTDMTRKSYSDPILREERSKRIMMDRWGQPEDLVGPCIFLASDAAKYITGIDLPVDGGWLANGL